MKGVFRGLWVIGALVILARDFAVLLPILVRNDSFWQSGGHFFRILVGCVCHFSWVVYATSRNFAVGSVMMLPVGGRFYLVPLRETFPTTNHQETLMLMLSKKQEFQVDV